MPNESPFVQIDLTPEYKKNLRDLAKKYRNIRSDTQLVIEEIQRGNFICDRISRLGTDYLVYKVRVNNSNIQKVIQGLKSLSERFKLVKTEIWHHCYLVP